MIVKPMSMHLSKFKCMHKCMLSVLCCLKSCIYVFVWVKLNGFVCVGLYIFMYVVFVRVGVYGLPISLPLDISRTQFM